jgi:hypothetical protein
MIIPTVTGTFLEFVLCLQREVIYIDGSMGTEIMSEMIYWYGLN